MIINEIEKRLLKGGAKPGKFSPADKPITGRSYFSYRNDLSADSRKAINYASLKQFSLEKQYNPFGRIDPFEKTHVNQKLDFESIKSSSV